MQSSSVEVFRAFLRLGLTSFGGPLAHLGYFRAEFVERRRWISDSQFAQLLAACQFLPGPASSQLGFAIGLLRAGWTGALLAFAGFTLPSAVLLYALARFGAHTGSTWAEAITHGLKLVAVAVVAHGVMQMSRRMLVEVPLVLIAVGAAGAILGVDSPMMQLVVIVAGALLGGAFSRVPRQPAHSAPVLSYSPRTAAGAFVLVIVLLIGALTVQHAEPTLAGVAAVFYRAGAMVFGGGHVVLPLLETSVVGAGWLDRDTFLAGYGAAQAVPGPMFTLSAYLGAEIATGFPSVVSSAVALLSVFLPGLLLIVAVLPFWARLHTYPAAQRSIAGVNAAVVGLLAAALYDPVWKGAVTRPMDAVISTVAFVLLVKYERAALIVVAWCVAASLLLQFVGS